MVNGAEGKRIRIQGTVQGVGFRPWVYRTAMASGVTGRVWNDESGVTIDAFGDASALDRFEHALHGQTPPAARIAHLESSPIPAEPISSFTIVKSAPGTEHSVSIPPDLATCDDCAAEIADPSARRYRYAFTNCTNCGPRFTIATDAPYDRDATTMASFVMCPECRHEYEDVLDRRFHAQPIACPTCGPRLELLRSNGIRTASSVVTSPEPPAASDAEGHLFQADAISEAADALSRGLIVAVKGIGGFHLACDATSESAVTRLRARKHREAKPLAVMVRDVADAERFAVVGEAQRALLLSVERPIVLLDKRPDATIAESVAPRNRQIGVMLPYSPLHHILLADVGRPLVMTSGNLSDEPIAFTNDDATARLSGIADLILLHNRDIHTRCDDSVATVINGAPVLFRRSRGYVPRAVELPVRLRRPILATGALLKNTFCLASGSQAFLGPHIGDLENLETYDSFTTGIERFERFVDIRPEAVACDLHPDYMSTAYARSTGLPIVQVQHHHAHVAAVMAEHGLQGPVVGIAYDGTGYGTDGTAWGGEILLATTFHYDRLATFRPIALAGGDVAIRDPWRIALALLLDAFDGDLPGWSERLVSSVDSKELSAVTTLIRRHVNVSLARGVGRYFDGFGALFLNRRRAAFEGQVALEWNQVAAPGVGQRYPFDVNEAAQPWEVDLRPTVKAACADALRGVPAGTISAAFHNTVAAATAMVVRRSLARVGRVPVVATGGCFQNVRLAESVVRTLDDIRVHLHRDVPPGDGGIALGQVVVGNALTG